MFAFTTNVHSSYKRCLFSKFLEYHTFVTPIAPIFPPIVVLAAPQPTAPDNKLHSPSVAIPRLTAWLGGGGTLHIFAQA